MQIAMVATSATPEKPSPVDHRHLLEMSANTDRFQALIRQVAPLDAEAGKLKLEMVQLAGEIALEMAAEAFPEARIIRCRAVAEVKPSDNGARCKEAIDAITEHRVPVKMIVHDQARHVVLLLTDPLLPPAAKPKTKKKGNR